GREGADACARANGEDQRPHGRIHLRDRLSGRRTQDSSVLHRSPACWREPGRCAESAGGRPPSTNSDVGCAVAKHAETGPASGDTGGQLSGARTATVCGSGSEFSRRVPPRAGSARRRVSPRSACPRPGAVTGCADAVPPRTQRAGTRTVAGLAGGAIGGEEDGAEFGTGQGYFLPFEALDEADIVPAPTGSPTG